VRDPLLATFINIECLITRCYCELTGNSLESLTNFYLTDRRKPFTTSLRLAAMLVNMYVHILIIKRHSVTILKIVHFLCATLNLDSQRG
jgi:hypothetical protein